jgi:hypothetical protein
MVVHAPGAARKLFAVRIAGDAMKTPLVFGMPLVRISSETEVLSGHEISKQLTSPAARFSEK